MPSTTAPRRRNQLGELLKRAGTAAPKAGARRPPAALPPLVVKSIALTPAALATLQRLIREVARAHGRTTSASAIVRALLRYAERQGAGKALGALVAAETASGEVVWGRARAR
jgi:hypothetical protein